MRTNPVLRLVLAFALSGALLAGCGGSDDDAAPADSAAQESGDAGSVDAGSDDGGSSQAGSGSGDGGIVDAIGGEGAQDAIDSLGLETKGSALVSATGAERFEMEGEVGHLYLGDDAGVPQGTECMIVGAVLSEGEQIVVHLADGSEVTCP